MGERCPEAPGTPLSYDGGVRAGRGQAAELLAELEEDDDEAGFESDEDEPADEVLDADVLDDFDAGLLLDEEPRESLR
ncbi:hypothetical protein ABB07_21910 [Streptomyces incarnatus]|uniref:DNA primase n=1 Tax=Streptomyces incarnatus TaxID=665007 RepID=A0ABN4GGA0_9ACTN|nr:hypothetical protein ABB07_21910 [Streptomyces incarnatus]